MFKIIIKNDSGFTDFDASANGPMAIRNVLMNISDVIEQEYSDKMKK